MKSSRIDGRIEDAVEDAVEAAEAALDALRKARDLLKVAKAPRTLRRVRAAITSAEGAVRAAGYRTRRMAMRSQLPEGGQA